MLTTDQQEKTGMMEIFEEQEEEEEEEQPWHASYLAIVHQGAVIPVLDLEDIIQQYRVAADTPQLQKHFATVTYDVLLALLEEEKAQERNH